MEKYIKRLIKTIMKFPFRRLHRLSNLTTMTCSNAINWIEFKMFKADRDQCAKWALEWEQGKRSKGTGL